MSSFVFNQDVLTNFRNFAPESAVSSAPSVSEPMTVCGSFNKALLLVAITVVMGVLSCAMPSTPLFAGSLFFGFVIAVILMLKPYLAPYLAPLYALCEGIVLGFVAQCIRGCYAGIFSSALFCTVLTLLMMLVVYRFDLIRVNGRFKSILSFCLLGALCYYIATALLQFTGLIPDVFYFDPILLIFNLLACGLAAFTLLVDFDTIREGADMALPQYMEWYCAYGLLMTLVWLLFELVHLLIEMADDD